jgi:hypothetical protein
MERENSWRRRELILPPNPFAPAISAAKKIQQRGFQRLRCHEPVKGDAEFAAGIFDPLIVFVEPSQVFRAQRFRIEINFAFGFGILKKRGLMKLERDFIRIENLKQNDFVTGGGEAAQFGFQRIHRREQIGNENDQTAFSDEFGGAAKRFRKRGFFSSVGLFEREHELTQMAVPMTRGEIIAHAFVERDQTRRIALAVSRFIAFTLFPWFPSVETESLPLKFAGKMAAADQNWK